MHIIIRYGNTLDKSMAKLAELSVIKALSDNEHFKWIIKDTHHAIRKVIKPLKSAMGRYGALWMTMERYGGLWSAMDDYGALWVTMERYG